VISSRDTLFNGLSDRDLLRGHGGRIVGEESLSGDAGFEWFRRQFPRQGLVGLGA
jgi:hypothetical protein